MFCTVHESERPFSLLDGVPDDKTSLLPGIWLSDEECSRAEEYRRGILQDVSSLIITVHPGANWVHRCWEPEKYGELISRILLQAPNGEVLVLGTSSELHVLERTIEMAGREGEAASRIHLVADLDLRTVMALIAHSSLFVGNDSGLFHVAAAAGVPAVAIFGPGDRNRWGRYPISRAPVMVVGEELDCIPCSQQECIYEGECLRRITVEKVWEVVKNFVDAPQPYGRKLDTNKTTAMPES